MADFRRTDPVRSRLFLDQVYRVLGENVADPDFGVEELAAALVMSRATLYRRLDGVVKHSVMELIWRHRLERAALWLTETDASVGKIAREVGFKSVAHFCSRFRERFGVSPTAYRGGGESVEARPPPTTPANPGSVPKIVRRTGKSG